MHGRLGTRRPSYTRRSERGSPAISTARTAASADTAAPDRPAPSSPPAVVLLVGPRAVRPVEVGAPVGDDRGGLLRRHPEPAQDVMDALQPRLELGLDDLVGPGL